MTANDTAPAAPEAVPASAQGTRRALTLLQGDAVEMLRTLPDQSIQCCVTSPPYFGLRKYTDDPREIGHEATPAAFVGALVAVFHEARRVLRDDGTLWLNLGDSYVNNPSTSLIPRAEQGNGTGVFGIYGEHQHTARKGTPNKAQPMIDAGYKKKDLLGIPWRVAFALQDDGWYLRSDIIWNKPNCMPESVTDRPTRAHEYVFLLSKSARYFYDAAAIAEQSQSDHDSGNGFKRAARVSYQNADGSPRGNDEKWHMQATRNRRTVWTIPTQSYSGAHYATMPEALIAPCILAGSAAGDTVLDPFGGSGTVGKVALRYQRSAVLIELNAAYIDDHIEKRTDKVQIEMFV